MGALFGKTPKPQPVAAMPDEEDPSVKARRRAAAAETQGRTGRTSTMMSTRGAAAQPGTTSYTNSLLGQG